MTKVRKMEVKFSESGAVVRIHRSRKRIEEIFCEYGYSRLLYKMHELEIKNLILNGVKFRNTKVMAIDFFEDLNYPSKKELIHPEGWVYVGEYSYYYCDSVPSYSDEYVERTVQGVRVYVQFLKPLNKVLF